MTLQEVQASPQFEKPEGVFAPFFDKIFPRNTNISPTKSGVTFSNADSQSIAPYKHNTVPELHSPDFSTGLQGFTDSFDKMMKAELEHSSKDQQWKIKRWSENEKKMTEELINSISSSTWMSQMKSWPTMGTIVVGLIGTAMQYNFGNQDKKGEILRKGLYATILGASSVMSSISGYKTGMTEVEKTESNAQNYELQKDVEQNQQQLETFMMEFTESIRKFLALQQEDAAIKSRIMARGA